MTQEEKAKAYDEALKWMRELYPGLHGATKEDAEHYFPQLRESEDERIRKALIDFFGEQCDMSDVNGVYAYEVVEYLEKQKEQKPAWSEEDKNYYDTIVRKLEVIGDDCGLSNNQIKFLREHCPPYRSEWNEEDEEALDMCLDVIPKKWKTKSGTLLTKWLKDSVQPQPKREWSEEDESCWNLIWDILDGPFTASKEGCKKAAAWFSKNCPKGTKSLRPCPSWKPNEEQMEALAYASQVLGSDLSPKAAKASEELEHLREQLKKL